MAERATIARPYAKAAFKAARGANALPAWSQGLRLVAAIVEDPRAAALVKNPRFTATQVADFVIGVAGSSLDPEMQNLLRILAANHRLLLLPEITEHFEALRAEVENTVDVEVISAVKLDAAQTEKFATALNTRLKRQVKMRNTVDATLIGGAVVRAGDLVIDGSLKGRLERLGTELTS